MFWDERSQSQSLSNLRYLLTILRKDLGDYLSIDRTSVAILAEADLQNQASLSPVVKGTNIVVSIVITVLAILAIVGFVDKSGKWFATLWVLISTVVAITLIHWAWFKKTGN